MKDITVLDQGFNPIYIFDRYESLLWVDRFYQCGSFEIYTPITNDILNYLVKDNYLVSKDSDHVMIIEDFAIESDAEQGDHIKIIGRSLESMLERRIVWSQTNIDGNLQDGISKLLYANVIGGDGTDAKPRIVGGDDRKITNFIFERSEDPTIKSLTMENQYTGDDLLSVIETLCETNKIGFRILLNDNNQFVFSLYNGIDKSYRQSALPYVVFRPTFDNIINSNYKEENSKGKTITLVAGEGEGSSRITRTVGTGSGLLRKELFTDARDIQKEEGWSPAKYNAMLDKRGQEKLSEANKDIKTFDGKCDTSRLYVYGRDFKMGDIVHIANEYGMESPARITEFTWNYSTSGIETYPTFVAVEEEESN